MEKETSSTSSSETGKNISVADGESRTTSVNVCSRLTNPLQIPVILSHMFNLCPPQLLRNFRLVSKQWHDLSLTAWRTTIPVIFRQDESAISASIPVWPGYICNSGTSIDLDTYVKLYWNNPQTQTDTKPFRYMKLMSWCYEDRLERLQYFWDVLGSNVTTLELHRCTFYEREDFRRIIFQFCPNMKQLLVLKCYFLFIDPPPNKEVEFAVELKYKEPTYGEHLHLRSFTFEAPSSCGRIPVSDIQKLPVSWFELLTHFQSLTNIRNVLDLQRLHRYDVTEIKRDCELLLKTIQVVRGHDSRKLALKNLEFLPFLELPSTFKSLALLGSLQLPMKNKAALRFHMDMDTDEENVKGVLQVYEKTLHRLELGSDLETDESTCPIYLAFPYGFHLEHLSILRMSGVLCPSMGFLRFTPNLTALALTHGGNRNEEEPFIYMRTEIVSNTAIAIQEMPSGKQLILPYLKGFASDYIFTEGDLQRLVGWMPNVQLLEMVLDDKQFEIVCNNWRNLRGLKVLGEELTDVGVTRWIVDNFGENAVAIPPNITYLENLFYFSFWSNLTDASVFQGFLKLRNLRHLHVGRHPMPLSDEARIILKMKNVDLREGINGCRVPGDEWM